MSIKRGRIVTPKRVHVEPSKAGFFKAFLTLGAADWNDMAYVTCGDCGAKFEQRIHSTANWAVCDCCGAKNVWGE